MRYGRFGVIEYDRDRATKGYTLFSPLVQKNTYLLDLDGKLVHKWDLLAQPGNYAQLLPNGNLFVSVKTDQGPTHLMAKGGHLMELDWDGKLVWEYVDHAQHHDFRRLPNGNTIYLGWEILPAKASARVQGGLTNKVWKNGIWGDYIREVNPAGETVWEWHAHEQMKIENYPNCPLCSREEWAHANSIWPLQNGDVMVSWRHNHLIAVISRTTKKFKWEWRNPILGHQHDFQALENGNYMLFANGTHAPSPHGYSRVIEFKPELKEIIWEYAGTPKYTFNSPFISGAQRLWSGNTLICEGQWGRLFEVTTDCNIVWEYISPFFVPNTPLRLESGTNCVFRAYRYKPYGIEIQGRLG